MSPEKLPAAELAAAIAKREISSLEAVEACIARLQAVQPALNAVVAERYEQARAEAREADRRLAVGDPAGPLHGLPVTIKESLDVTGLPSTGGFTSRAGHRAEADEPHVARWRAAGAIVLAKTNVAQGLAYIETDNPLYGRTNNPWDLSRTPGGSSGGEAAVIAAGASPLGLGTDIGGSVRNPAAFCGIAGLNPTAGRMPDEGTLSFHRGQRVVPSQVGVLGREVADVALGVRVAESPDGPAPLGDPGSVDLTGLRVGYYTSDLTFPAIATAGRAVTGAAEALRAAGATVQEWTPPDPQEANALHIALIGADEAGGIRKLLGDGPADPRLAQFLQMLAMPPAEVAAIQEALRASGEELGAAALEVFRFDRSVAGHLAVCEAVIGYRERWRAAMAQDGISVILCPASPLPALTHGATLDFGVMGATTVLYNVLGLPAGVVPWTRVAPDEGAPPLPGESDFVRRFREVVSGSAGLPMGVQVVARPWRDHEALAAMAVIEAASRATGEHPGRPPL